MDGVVKTAARYELRDLVSSPPSFEEIFFELYREADDGR